MGNITSTSEYSSQENIENESQNNQNRESGNANSPTRGLNLHSAEPQQIPEESRVTMGDWPDVSDDVPEYLPNRPFYRYGGHIELTYATDINIIKEIKGDVKNQL